MIAVYLIIGLIVVYAMKDEADQPILLSQMPLSLLLVAVWPVVLIILLQRVESVKSRGKEIYRRRDR